LKTERSPLTPTPPRTSKRPSRGNEEFFDFNVEVQRRRIFCGGCRDCGYCGRRSRRRSSRRLTLPALREPDGSIWSAAASGIPRDAAFWAGVQRRAARKSGAATRAQRGSLTSALPAIHYSLLLSF
jgi:hypothetical protein